MQPQLPPRKPDKGIHGVGGIPGAQRGQGYSYSREWYDKAAAKSAAPWEGEQGRARIARLAQELVLDHVPEIKRPTLMPGLESIPDPWVDTPLPPIPRSTPDATQLSLQDDVLRRYMAAEQSQPTAKIVTNMPVTSTWEATQQVIPDAVVAQNIYREPSIPSDRIITQVPVTSSPTAEQLRLPLPVGDEQLEIPGMWSTVYDPNATLPQFNRTVDKGSFWANAWHGAKEGFEYNLREQGLYPKSVVFERAPSSAYNHLNSAGNAGFVAGRIASDVTGHGSRKYIWGGVHPEDFVNRLGANYLKDVSRAAAISAPYFATLALGIGSGNYDPTNLGEGGRPDGYTAINADPLDPTKSTSPFYDVVIERGLFGRRGKVLPWEQFREERPDVSYEKYQRYKDYLFNKDDNLLRKMTGGLAKGTLDGINGPELSVMGYSVTPLGAAAALGTLAAVREGVKRFAALRR